MIEIGRLCIKLNGRDSGKECIVIDLIDKNHVLIDGNTRRRKCNIAHLEPLDKVFKIQKGATTKEIYDIFKLEKIKITKTESKKKEKKNEKPTKKRKHNEKSSGNTRKIPRTKVPRTKDKPSK